MAARPHRRSWYDQDKGARPLGRKHAPDDTPRLPFGGGGGATFIASAAQPDDVGTRIVTPPALKIYVDGAVSIRRRDDKILTCVTYGAELPSSLSV